jgi:small subunit ribosomal protein S18
MIVELDSMIQSRDPDAGLEQEWQNRLMAKTVINRQRISNMADETVNIAASAPAAGSSEGAAPAARTGGYQGQGGPRSGGGSRPPRPAGGAGGAGGRKFFRRKKVCKFTVEKIDTISYRDVRLLQQFVSDRGKIIPRRLSGTSAPFQRKLTRAIKQARAIALLPFAAKF